MSADAGRVVDSAAPQLRCRVELPPEPATSDEAREQTIDEHADEDTTDYDEVEASYAQSEHVGREVFEGHVTELAGEVDARDFEHAVRWRPHREERRAEDAASEHALAIRDAVLLRAVMEPRRLPRARYGPRNE